MRYEKWDFIDGVENKFNDLTSLLDKTPDETEIPEALTLAIDRYRKGYKGFGESSLINFAIKKYWESIEIPKEFQKQLEEIVTKEYW